MISEEKKNEKQEKQNIKIGAKINNLVTEEVLTNLAYASIIMIYFVFFNILQNIMPENILINYINASSLMFLGISILIIEKAYKAESDSLTIYGLEFLVLAIVTILIKYLPKTLGCKTQIYILICSYLFSAYYIIKTSILYTIEKKRELENLSDIKEIVKKEPIKRETKRKNKNK